MNIILTIGQVLFGGFFIYSGFNHFIGLTGMTGYAASKRIPLPKAAVIISGAALMLGGIGILTDMYIAQSLIVLAVFLIVTAFAMHDFWKVEDPAARQMQLINFTKNLALAGAALMMFAMVTY